MLIFRTIILLCCFATAAVAADPYEVSGIRLDVSADSSAEAKSKALKLAGEQAFDIVIQRLLPAEEQQKANPRLTAQQMESALSVMIGGLQIADEKFGEGRYLATATVRFKPRALRHLFDRRGVAHAENFSAPLLLLPMQKRGDDVVLWSDNNILLDTLRKNPLPQGLLPYVVPYGDIEDINLLTADAVQGFLQSSISGFIFADIVSRYQVGGVILMQGDIEGDKITISGRMLAHGRASDLPQKTYDIGEGGVKSATLLALQTFQESWKVANLISDKNNKKIYAILRGASLPSLHQQLQTLRSMAIIDKAHAVRVSARQAIIEIDFRASLEQLQLALFNYGLRLDKRQSTGNWHLRIL